MLDRIRDIHKGKSFAVLGSAPSLLSYFNRKEDVVIGVNGAGYVLETGDYFLSGDERAYHRSWFKSLKEGITLILRPQSAIYSDKLYQGNLQSSLIKQFEKFMQDNPSCVQSFGDLKWIASLNELSDVFFEELPVCIEPHIVLKTVSTDEPISRNQKKINVGGTSACMAVQVAYVMGAKEIHLYGVEFSNDISQGNLYSAGNYFYDAKNNETGMTLPSQRKVIDSIIKKIIEKGTNVFSHGPTNLENSIKLE